MVRELVKKKKEEVSLGEDDIEIGEILNYQEKKLKLRREQNKLIVEVLDEVRKNDKRNKWKERISMAVDLAAIFVASFIIASIVFMFIKLR